MFSNRVLVYVSSKFCFRFGYYCGVSFEKKEVRKLKGKQILKCVEMVFKYSLGTYD